MRRIGGFQISTQSSRYPLVCPHSTSFLSRQQSLCPFRERVNFNNVHMDFFSTEKRPVLKTVSRCSLLVNVNKRKLACCVSCGQPSPIGCYRKTPFSKALLFLLLLNVNVIKQQTCVSCVVSFFIVHRSSSCCLIARVDQSLVCRKPTRVPGERLRTERFLGHESPNNIFLTE